MGNIRISFIVAIYNVEQYIEECVKSICNIKCKEIEIILVDDGSIDFSGQICDELSKKDSRIKVVHQNNKGVSAARNIGLDLALGDWIVFVDGDDLLSSNFEKLILKEIDDKYDLIFFGYRRFNTELKEPYTNHFDSIKYNSHGGMKEVYLIQNGILNIDNPEFKKRIPININVVGPWGCLYKREAIENIRFIHDIIWAEDRLFKIELLNNIKNFKLIYENGYLYREHKNSITFKYTPHMLEACYKMLETMTELVMSQCKNIPENSLYIFVIREYLNAMRRSIYHKECPLSRKQIILEMRKWRCMPIIDKSFTCAKLNGFTQFSVRTVAYCIKYRFYNIADLLYRIKRNL